MSVNRLLDQLVSKLAGQELKFIEGQAKWGIQFFVSIYWITFLKIICVLYKMNISLAIFYNLWKSILLFQQMWKNSVCKMFLLVKIFKHVIFMIIYFMISMFCLFVRSHGRKYVSPNPRWDLLCLIWHITHPLPA